MDSMIWFMLGHLSGIGFMLFLFWALYNWKNP